MSNVCKNCGEEFTEEFAENLKKLEMENIEICSSCLQKEITAQLLRANREKYQSKSEIVGIIVGAIVGIVLGIILSIKYTRAQSLNALTFIIPVYTTSVAASLLSLIRKLYFELKSERNFVSGMITVLVSIIGSPVYSISRIIKCVNEIKLSNEEITYFTNARQSISSIS